MKQLKIIFLLVIGCVETVKRTLFWKTLRYSFNLIGAESLESSSCLLSFTLDECNLLQLIHKFENFEQFSVEKLNRQVLRVC